jgi:hypothetical protein
VTKRSIHPIPTSTTHSPLYPIPQDYIHDVQGYKGPGYAAYAHDVDAPHAADVHEGKPAAVHEGDSAHAQPSPRTSLKCPKYGTIC